MLILSHRVSVYVTRPEHVETVARMLSDAFGGATAFPTQGFWIMSDGSLAIDPTNVVYSCTHEAIAIDHPVVQEAIKFVFENSDEESVAVELDGTLFILDRDEVMAAQSEQSEVA